MHFEKGSIEEYLFANQEERVRMELKVDSVSFEGNSALLDFYYCKRVLPKGGGIVSFPVSYKRGETICNDVIKVIDTSYYRESHELMSCKVDTLTDHNCFKIILHDGSENVVFWKIFTKDIHVSVDEETNYKFDIIEKTMTAHAG